MAMTNSERVKKSREKNDCIAIRPPKELGAQIRAAAKKADVPLTIYITEAILARMESEN